jgi:hypothetical protein
VRRATRSLFGAFAHANPAPKRQQAITPRLMRGMCKLAGLASPQTHDAPASITADLAILGLFFAMRSCENIATPKPGHTKTVSMNGATFLDSNKRETPHDHPGLALSAHVTHTFEDQKNRDKKDRRSQKRTDDPALCPVQRAASLIERVRCLASGFAGDAAINTCAHKASQGVLVTLQFASGFLRSQLRHPCSALDARNHLDSTPPTSAPNPSGLVPPWVCS